MALVGHGSTNDTNLEEKYPEAVRAFEAELREEKEKQRLRKETKWQQTLERHRQSAYLREKMEQLLGSDEKQLRELMRLRDMMIHLKNGYGSEAMGYMRVSLRDKYPLAYEEFEKELGLRD